MTIGGALSELNNLLEADDIPCYYKPSIKAVMDTIALEQEPTTKNDVPDINVGKIGSTTKNDCETCIHNQGVLECDMYGCKYEPATKDYLGVDYLGVDAISRQAINGYIDYILSHGMGKRKSFDFIKKFVANMPSVTPQLSSGLEKNSKKLEKDFGESVSREEIDTMKYKVCCPMCDNKKCVKGTGTCEAEQWAKSKAEK